MCWIIHHDKTPQENCSRTAPSLILTQMTILGLIWLVLLLPPAVVVEVDEQQLQK
jgi:hypothetical protein